MAVVFRFYRIKESCISLYYNEKTEYNNCKFELERYKEKQRQNLFSDNVQLENIVLTNFNNEDTLLFDLLDESKRIYSFTKVSCIACVASDLKILNMLGDNIGFNNIIINLEYKPIIAHRKLQ